MYVWSFFAVLSQHVLSICKSSCNYRNLQNPYQNTMFFDDFQKCDEHVSCTLRWKFSLFFQSKFYQKIAQKMPKNRYENDVESKRVPEAIFSRFGVHFGPLLRGFWGPRSPKSHPRALQRPLKTPIKNKPRKSTSGAQPEVTGTHRNTRFKDCVFIKRSD